MSFDFSDFIVRAGLGLETEDRLLLGSHLVQGTYGGLLRLNNERYFQSIVWRALSPKYDVQIEREGHVDLILRHNSQVIAFEMKRWMTPRGTQELPFIRADINKLVISSANEKGMIIFSASDRGFLSDHLAFLEGHFAELVPSSRHVHLFNTFDKDNKPKEFWIALWLL